MFQNVRTGSMLYVLNSKDFTLKLAQVVGTGAPRNKAISNPQGQNPMIQQLAQFNPMNTADMVVDMSIKIDGEIKNIEGLPLMGSLVNFGNGLIVADSKEAVGSEIDSLQKQSADELSRNEYNQWVIEKCDELKSVLNPQLIKDKAYEHKIQDLESKIDKLMMYIQRFEQPAKKTKKDGNNNQGEVLEDGQAQREH